MVIKIKVKSIVPFALCGAVAGAVNGLLGAGGGMILIPLLTGFTDLKEEKIFPSSVCIIAPICIISILTGRNQHTLTIKEVLPYLFGSFAGGILSGTLGKRIPIKLLHRMLGVLILWGGIRYLC